MMLVGWYQCDINKFHICADLTKNYQPEGVSRVAYVRAGINYTLLVREDNSM